MMSGEDNQNDDKNVENPENQPEQDETASKGKSSGSGLFSKGDDGKHYPFSVPVDAADKPSEPSAPSDMQEPPEPAQDMTAATPERTDKPSEPSAPVSEESEEDIEASLDEGIFTNEILPEAGTDTPDPSDSRDDAEPVLADHVPDEEEAPVEPEIASPGTPPPSEPPSKGPSHAFDMGGPEMDEREFTETVKKKSRFGTVVASFVIFLLLIGVLIGGAFFYVKLRFDAPGSHAQSLTHIIKPKQGLRVIAEDLEKSGIIEDKNIFMIGAFLDKSHTSIKAGEFEFAPNASMSDVLETITKGKVLQHKITFAEGLTTQQIVETINNNPVLVGDIETTPKEGTLLPETYQFERGMTRQQIIDRMLKAQSDLVDKLWPDRDDNLGVVTPGDALILASIIEKETGLSSERSRVSAVFNNRLKKNMRLQSDPTVIYGISGGAGKLERAITRSDLETKTPYNTYKIDGLPPTPIANPGKASIIAALKPAKTDDLYFVADGTGGHAFATTLEGHNENVARWRKLEKEVTPPETPPAKPVSEPAKPSQKAANEKSGVLKKTTTLKTDKKASTSKPEKSDLAIPVTKPKVSAPGTVEEVEKKVDAVSEKAGTIFVKPEEAPLPRKKPNALIEQGIDKINVSPLPEQKVPQTNVTTPNVPNVVTPQVTPPSIEPTPELESVKPAPSEKPFNPFQD